MPIITCTNCGAKNRIDDRANSLQPVCGKCHKPLPVPGQTQSNKPVIITDANFAQEVLQADRPVLLDCWAPWCGPCRMIAPTIDQLAAESAGRYKVAKLNTDENPGTASQFKIDAIPTLLIFNQGQLADRIVGLASKPTILSKLNQFITARV